MTHPHFLASTVLFSCFKGFYVDIRGRLFKKECHIFQQGFLVFFQSEDIVPFLFHDAGAGLSLTVQGICGDELFFYVQVGEHFLKHGDFVGLFRDLFLSENNALFCEICGNNL